MLTVSDLLARANATTVSVDMGGGGDALLVTSAGFVDAAADGSTSSRRRRAQTQTRTATSALVRVRYVPPAGSANRGVWLGIGVGTRMVGSRAVVGMDPSANPDRVGPVAVYALNGQSTSQVVAVGGELASMGITNATFSVNAADGSSELSFRVSRSSQAFPVFSGPANLLLALGGPGSRFAEHTRERVVSLDLAVLASSSPSSPGTAPTPASLGPVAYPMNSIVQAHIAFATLAFVLCFPLGACFSLLRPPTMLRGKPAPWFVWHRAVQIAGLVLAVIGFALGVAEVDANGASHFSTPHRALGLALFVVVLVQVALGLARPHVNPKSPAFRDQSKQRKAWLHSHRLFAAFLLVAGAAQVILGAAQGLPL